MTQPFLAAFSGTAVEFFETIVIAYAVLRAGHAREALGAVVLGHAVMFMLATAFFPLYRVLPMDGLTLLAALLLTAMGLHWTQKSLRRMARQERPRWATDPMGKVNVAEATTYGFSFLVFAVMLKSSLIEAAEILVVVVPVGAASQAWSQVILGVSTGIAVVSLAALVLHGQLRKIPEVKLKLAAGLLLGALGVSWLVELV
ncbi:hypothetical protein J057_16870 [Marinobacter nanhaiticus D15-8W]|uniref:GDT1 family protein n=1 Tax=Marinobacter nanhaiticus D15-8W TaxID=626887 RepID=N6VSE3_9GAMM|nr:hypothetical protein [Marinobacter nanhaiticus]ENO13090.1 hypothetical protein J057_16870 [Marinobacter nanhaiticus D15-8W]